MRAPRAKARAPRHRPNAEAPSFGEQRQLGKIAALLRQASPRFLRFLHGAHFLQQEREQHAIRELRPTYGTAALDRLDARDRERTELARADLLTARRNRPRVFGVGLELDGETVRAPFGFRPVQRLV